MNETLLDVRGLTVEFQIDDDLIDPGQKVRITVIGRSSAGLEWIEWSGDDTGDPVLDDNHRFDGCDQRTDCASVWEVSPTKDGTHTLRARARDKTGFRTEWTTLELKVRKGPTPTPTPSTPTPTPGPGTPTVTPTPTSSIPSVTIQLSDDSIDLGEEVEITVHDDVLTIKAEHKEEKTEGTPEVTDGESAATETKGENRRFYRRELRYGSFHRSFSLPAGVDADKAEAKFENGVLKLTLPKAEANKPKQIKVGTGSES